MSTDIAPAAEEVTLTIDGISVSVPKGSLIIRAAEKLGIAIPRFCDHPLLDPMGACRQCLVEIPDVGNGRGMPKPQAACTTEVAPGMVVSTQVTSPVAEKAQRGVLELLLINHPLDCPICDKGGECPLQNQALSNGPGESRFHDLKRTYPKPIRVSQQVLLDRERCVLCARCTRFSEQISGDPFIALVERGALQQVGFYEDQPYDSYFSGNVVQICPVGALTSADYRFQARPFDLVSTPTACEHCASGCAMRTDHRHYQVKRRLAGLDMDVNDEWSCDKGRFGFYYGRQTDRLTSPMVRENGALRPASWPEAIDVVVAGLKAAGESVGVLTGGRLTLESQYAASKFARTVLGTNNIDFRSRPMSAEETGFLTSRVASATLTSSVTYADLAQAKKVVLVAFEPEDESPIVFLKLRKAVRKNKLVVETVAPFRSRGSVKLQATLKPAAPGTEAAVVSGLEVDGGTIVLVGERAATSPGTLTAVAMLAEKGARIAWIPRRAGEMGAIQAGCLPTLLPGGRPVADAAARVDAAAAWETQNLPTAEGLDAEQMLTAGLKAFLVAGVEARDFRDPDAVRAALESAEFVVSLEQRVSDVTERASVVLPVALLEEQPGTFVDWEHRERTFGTVNRGTRSPMTDVRVLAALADAMGSDLGFRTPAAAKAEIAELGAYEGTPAVLPVAPQPERSEGLVLATWRQLIDEGRGQDGADFMRATQRPATIKVSTTTAQRLGLSTTATVRTDHGAITLPVEQVADMVDDVVWLPANQVGCCVTETLHAVGGDVVTCENATEGVTA